MRRFICTLFAAFAVAALVSASALAGAPMTTNPFSVVFTATPECGTPSQVSTFKMKATNVTNSPQLLHFEVQGLSSNDFAPYALADAKPSLLGKDIPVGYDKYSFTVYQRYWEVRLQPGKSVNLSVSLLIADWTKFPYSPLGPMPAIPYPMIFSYQLFAGQTADGNELTVIKTFRYCGVALPGGYGNWYGWGK